MKAISTIHLGFRGRTQGDQDKAEEQIKAREDQPGILLFRRGAVRKSAMEDKPYEDGLVVLVVGEEPTSGLHKRQFENAVAWINALRPQMPGTVASKPVKILGPTFSGSLPSLAQLLVGDRQFAKLIVPAANSSVPRLSIYSGGITSEVMVRWFDRQTRTLDPAATADPVDFHSFQQSGNVQIHRYQRLSAAQRIRSPPSGHHLRGRNRLWRAGKQRSGLHQEIGRDRPMRSGNAGQDRAGLSLLPERHFGGPRRLPETIYFHRAKRRSRIPQLRSRLWPPIWPTLRDAATTASATTAAIKPRCLKRRCFCR